MTVYMMARIQIDDRDRYGQYEAGFMEIFEKYDGQLLAVDEAPEVMEGTWDVTRTVLIGFPSTEAARAWYHSEEYQALAQHRFASSRGDAVLVSGLDEAPPA